ncbi:hypothetical protein BZA77DRAFT_356388 [Pyronema omphalodes]|nr:hypothetical protein BZA77DRAFT_356388 [Pyronema omphalodes]
MAETSPPKPSLSHEVPSGSSAPASSSVPAPSAVSDHLPSPATSILPSNLRADTTAATSAAFLNTPAHSHLTSKSFLTAVSNCREKVSQISLECRRFNLRYRDTHFDLSLDEEYCLNGLLPQGDEDITRNPKTTARVDEIFDEPKFYKDGVTAGDVKQGNEGDCWFMAALAMMTNVKGLIEKICVARDEEVGVYGFVFMRDGEWESVVVDDQLYLDRNRYDDVTNLQEITISRIWKNEEDYEKNFFKGSEALYFAASVDKNETWVPLLEKAYAKFHCDYSALYGGFTGEAVEDLTGGVTTDIICCDILDKDRFWKEQLSLVNKDFLFGASFNTGEKDAERRGVEGGHAYSVLKAVEAKGERFVLIRNPWGQIEWRGPWSDGSKEWTPEWMSLLDHTFGDDGQFWMTYRDFLRKFDLLDRTRLFDDSWHVTESRWVNYEVTWAADYAPTQFEITVVKPGSIVVVLSQLDTRFFRGLEGRFTFELAFRIHKHGEKDYLARSQPNVGMSRSVSIEINLEPGQYTVMFSAEPRFKEKSFKTKDVVKRYKNLDRKKFRQVAMNADLAHARAGSTSFWREADRELQTEADEMFGDAPELPAFGEKKDKDDKPGEELPVPKADEFKLEDSKRPPRPAPDAAPTDPLELYKWKARVCVGLKVYSKDSELEVSVIMPKETTPADVVDLDSSTRDLQPQDTKPTAKTESDKKEDVCICSIAKGSGEDKVVEKKVDKSTNTDVDTKVPVEEEAKTKAGEEKAEKKKSLNDDAEKEEIKDAKDGVKCSTCGKTKKVAENVKTD